MSLNIIDLTDAERMLAAQAWFGLIVSFLVGGLYWPVLLRWKPLDVAPMSEHDPTRKLWRAILVDQASQLAREPEDDPADDSESESDLEADVLVG